jgi:hypothetical protein
VSVLAAVTTLLPALSKVLDRVIPDPEQKAKAQLELMRLQQEGAFKEMDAELQVNLAQAKINEVEAASQNGFQAGWRPLAGYACVSGMIYEFLVRLLLPWLLTVCGVADVPLLPSLDEVLFELMFGMLGLGTLRSADRWKRVNTIKDLGK